jgi:myosin heavy subunit
MTTTKAMDNRVAATSKVTVPNEPIGAYPQRTPANPSQTNVAANFKGRAIDDPDHQNLGAAVMNKSLADEFFDKETRDAVLQQSKILLAAATDPEGCRARLAELKAATKKLYEARDAAEARKQEAVETERRVTDALIELTRGREEHATRVAAAERSFKDREAALAQVEQRHAETTQRLAELEETLRKGHVRLEGAARTMRQYLDAISPAEGKSA